MSLPLVGSFAFGFRNFALTLLMLFLQFFRELFHSLANEFFPVHMEGSIDTSTDALQDAKVQDYLPEELFGFRPDLYFPFRDISSAGKSLWHDDIE